MEKVLQELFLAHFGRPYRSNGTKIHLDTAMKGQNMHQIFLGALGHEIGSSLFEV